MKVMSTTHVSRGRATTIAAVVALLTVVLAACGGSTKSSTVNIVAYSVPKPAYDALTAAFQQTAAGKGAKFTESYGPSGDQSRAVIAGQKADYVGFSVAPDLTNLVPKYVDSTWNSGSTKGLVSESVVVITVRKGNPLGIKGWDDLTKPGVQIVTPDPASSGSAKWNILAAYTHVLLDGGTDADAQTYLKAFFKNVVAKPTSGSKATQTFLNGTGNVLISYEDEAIDARQAGSPVDYIVPTESILIENPAAVTKKASPMATKFLSFVESEAGQQIFAAKGFRPVLTDAVPATVAGANDPAHPFPTVAKLETIADLGGWTAVNAKYFDKTNGIVTKIESGSG